MKRSILLLTLVFGHQAFAQYIQGGASVGQGCNYPVQAGRGAVSESDDLQRLRKEKESLRKKVARKKSDWNKKKNAVKKLERDIGRVLSPGASKIVLDAMTTGNCGPMNCSGASAASYNGANQGREAQPISTGSPASTGAEGPRTMTADPNNPFCIPDRNSNIVNLLGRYCNGGAVDSEICAASNPITKGGRQSGDAVDNCRTAIQNYPKDKADEKDLKDEMDSLNAELKDKDTAIDDAKDTADDDDNKKTEGCQFCQSMSQAPAPSIWQSALSTLAIGAVGFATYKGVENAQDLTARAGYPVSPVPAIVASYPFLQAALSGGGAGGVGSGGYACSGTVGNQNMSPYGQISPFSPLGALYSPQSGAFGYPNSIAGNGTGYPGYGYGGYPNYGIQVGSQIGGQYGIQIGAQYGGQIGTQISPYPNFGGQYGAATGSALGSSLALQQIQQQALIAQDYAQRASTIAQLQGQMTQIQSQIYAVGSGATPAYQIAPYPGANYGTTSGAYGLQLSGGPVPVPVSNSTSVLGTYGTYGSTGVINSR